MRNIIFTFLIVVISTIDVFGQDTQYLRQQIDKAGGVRSVALTRTAVLALNGKNDIAGRGNIPNSLWSRLTKLRNEGSSIIDIIMKSDGSWLVLYDHNGYAWEGNLPTGLQDALKTANEAHYNVTSADWDNEGSYCLISKEHYYYSYDIRSIIKGDGTKSGDETKFGNVKYICMVEDGSAGIICYTNGYSMYGTMPSGLKTELNRAGAFGMKPCRVKIYGTSYYYVNESETRYSYNLD